MTTDTVDASGDTPPVAHSTALVAAPATAGIVSGREWNSFVQQAETIAQTNIVPKDFRGKPHDIIAVALIGREMGLSMMMSMLYVDVIEGRPSVKPELMGARIRSAGHKIKVVEWTDEVCTLHGIRTDGETLTVTFTIADARRAGLVKERSNWEKWPKAMLWARALAMLGRALFADAIMGASYVPEELGAHVDVNGAVIDEADITDVEVVEEYRQPTPPPPLTPAQEHAKLGADLFRYGWPAKGRSGDQKGKPPHEVDDDDLHWYTQQTSRDEKYAAADEKRRAWCRIELERRAGERQQEAPHDPGPDAPEQPLSPLWREAFEGALIESPAVPNVTTHEHASHYVDLYLAEDADRTNGWAQQQIQGLQKVRTAS